MNKRQQREECNAWIWGGLMLAAGVVFACVMVMNAEAHGDADWIAKGGYKNASGEQCCGVADCFVIDPTKVSSASAGYWLKLDLGTEFIAKRDTLTSRDGQFWRCRVVHWSGTQHRTERTRCFFVPPDTI